MSSAEAASRGPLHGYESGPTVCIPGCKYVEVHELSELVRFDDCAMIMFRPNRQGRITASAGFGGGSSWFFEARIAAVSRGEIEGAHRHWDGAAIEGAARQ